MYSTDMININNHGRRRCNNSRQCLYSNKKGIMAIIGALLIYMFIAAICGWGVDQC